MSRFDPHDLLPRGGAGLAAGCLAFCVALTALALWMHQPPRPLGTDAPPERFSAARAHYHLTQFATVPHPTGSPENAAVRDYLLAAIRDAGHEPELHEYTHKRRVDRPGYSLSYVENIVVRVRGTGDGSAFALIAHYDSVPYGPGAADDGSGVVVMLETLRALKHHPPLKNDVLFIFTDGEEAGLVGAHGFIRHPYYQDCKMVMNYEARGHYGPGYMYETGPENGWLIRQLKTAAEKPIANSMMFDVAGRMPTTTDYEVLKRDGMPGMNFAFIGGFKYYHTPNDSPEHMSLATLQHQGGNALAMTLHLGMADLSDVRAPDATYFNTLGGHLVVYPMSWARPLAALAALLYAAMLAVGWRRGHLSLPGAALGALALVVAVLVTAALVGALTLLGWLRFNEYMIYNSDLFFAGFTFLTIALMAVVCQFFLRAISVWSLAAGALAWWLAGMIAAAAALPGAAYVFTWPLAASSAAMLALFLLGPGSDSRARAGILLASAAVPLVLLSPWVYVCSVAVTIVPAPAWMSLAVLVMAAFVPVVAVILRPAPWALPAAASAIATPLLLLAYFWFQFSPEYPKMNHLCYGMDCSTGEAFWLSNDEQLDEWTRQFFPDDTRATIDAFRPGDRNPYRRAPAPLAGFRHPEVDVVEEAITGDKRELRLRVRSPREANIIRVLLPPGTPVYAASLNGIALGTDGDTPQLDDPGAVWSLHYQGLSPDGLDLRIRTDAGPLRLTVLEESSGVPPVAGVEAPPRPAHMISQNNVMRWWEPFKSNRVYSRKDFEL